MSYDCPVCGYSRLRKPPDNHLICACCGTEFGYEDFAETLETRRERWRSLRTRWIERNMPWFSPVTARPLGWDPLVQLAAARLLYRIDARQGITATATTKIVHEGLSRHRQPEMPTRG